MSKEMQRAAVSTLPLSRAGAPPETAMAYVYLMLNTFATGQVLRVDGGRSLT